MQNNRVKASFDGACEPRNPGGHMGLGWVIGGESQSRYIAAAYGNSNNVAEYLALIEILRYATSHAEVTNLNIMGDSQLVCYQLCGEYSVRSDDILPLFRQAKHLLAELEKRGCSVRVVWLPREHNAAADAASKLALTDHGITLTERKPPPGFTSRLGDMGKRLSVSAIKVGRLLDLAGLRNERQPTERALRDGLARQRFDGFGPVTDWNIEKVMALIRPVEVEDSDRHRESGSQQPSQKPPVRARLANSAGTGLRQRPALPQKL